MTLSRKSRVYGNDFLDLCEKAKRGEITIYSIAVGASPAEWIVEWLEKTKKAVQQELLK